MPRDNTVDNAIAAAQEKMGAETIEGVDEETRQAEAPTDPVEEAETEEVETAESPEGEEQEEISDQAASAETETQEAAPTPEAVSTVAAPAFWTGDNKALFAKAPPEVQKAISEESLRIQQQMSRLANESQRGKAWEERVNSDFQTKEELDAHRAQLRLQGVGDEVGELHRYRAWNTVMKNDPLTAVRALIVEHGITREALNGETQSEGQERDFKDPRVDEIQEQLKQEREAREAAARAAEAQATGAKVAAWKTSNDRYGKPRAEFATLYAPQIDAEWQVVLNEAQSTGENITLEESLTRAHDRVQDRFFKAHGINPNQPKKPTQEQRAQHAEKVKGAITVATGAPRSDVVAKKPRREFKNDREWADAKVKAAEEKISRRH
jgi:hypothetical protein